MNNFIIKSFIRRLLDRDQKKKKALYAEIGQSIDAGFKIRIDNIPEKNTKLLYIGDKSIIGCNFIYESGRGIVQIGNNTFLGGCTIICHNKIKIGDYVQIAWGTYLYDHNAHSTNLQLRRQDIIDEYKSISNGKSDTENKNWDIVRSEPIVVEDDVWIGMNCIILNGVTIGRGAVIGAGSVVRRSVPPFCVVCGNPARVVRFIYKPCQIEQVQKQCYSKNGNFITEEEYIEMIKMYQNIEV